MALGGKVVDFVRLHLLNNAYQVGGIGQIAIMQDELATRFVRILVQVINAIGVKRGGAALYAVNHVAFAEQKFSQVRTILARDTCYQSCFIKRSHVTLHL